MCDSVPFVLVSWETDASIIWFDQQRLGMNCLVCVILLDISGLHHIIPAQVYSTPYGICVYTMQTDGQ